MITEGGSIAIIETIGVYGFVNAFQERGRMAGWTTFGLEELFHYLYDLSQDMGEHLELDVIAIDSEFVEYLSFQQIQQDYDNIETMRDLQDRTTVIPIKATGGYIIRAF